VAESAPPFRRANARRGRRSHSLPPVPSPGVDRSRTGNCHRNVRAQGATARHLVYSRPIGVTFSGKHAQSPTAAAPTLLRKTAAVRCCWPRQNPYHRHYPSLR
jgi:hypothetical protein